MPHILLIEDDEELVLQLSKLCQDLDFTLVAIDRLRDAHAALTDQFPDILLLAESLPDGSCEKLLQRTELAGKTEIIVLGDSDSPHQASDRFELGVTYHLSRPLDLDYLKAILRDVADELGETAGAGTAEQKIRLDGFGLMLGSCKPMQRIFRLIRKVSKTDAAVLLIGESGVGKELAAKTIHEMSNCADGPFVSLNCGAVPNELIESELFGHVKGAFTGATTSHEGYFARAHGGTLFLDEITEMPLDLQVKLLRVLEERSFVPVGGSKEKVVSVRLLAATNRDPAGAIEDGRLREDLYYRLAQFPLRIPPLRERGEDVVGLTEVFLAEYNQDQGLSTRISSDALDAIRMYDWPGNIRELRNAIRQAHIVASGEIRPGDVPMEGIASHREATTELPVGTSLAEAEKELIEATLSHYEGDQKRCAEVLGISVQTLRKRLNAYRKSS